MGLRCPCSHPFHPVFLTGCDYSPPDVDIAAIQPLLTIHGFTHMGPAIPGQVGCKAPRIDRSAVDKDVSEEDGDGFSKMCAITVVPVAICVRRTDLLPVQQSRGENIKSFFAKVKGKAMTCGYTKKCPVCADQLVDYTDEIIRDVLVHSLHDPDIRQEVLGLVKLNEMMIPELLAHIEGKEMARDAVTGSASGAVAVSSYVKGRKSASAEDPKDKDKKGSAKFADVF